LALATLSLPRAEAQAGCPRAVGFHRQLEWTTPDKEKESAGRGLYLFECDPSGWNSRLLLETASGARVVLTGTLDARRGLELLRLHDDATGWWIASRRELRVHGRDLRDFLKKAYEQLEPAPGRSTAYSVTSSEGFALELEVAMRGHGESDWRQILEAARAGGLAGELAEQLPSGVRQAVPLLRALPKPAPDVESTGQTISYPAILLHGVQPSPVAAEASLTEVGGTLRKGLIVTDPLLHEFASRFRSVKAAEPLADHRLTAVVPPVGEPRSP
jgi:hypothetical protein